MERQDHPFQPVYDGNSRILILGTMPSRASRKNQFYYGHPQNRFWKVLAALLKVEPPQTNEEKRALLISNRIALWDVLNSCLIESSEDSSIREPVCNDFEKILKTGLISKVFTNGEKADSLYLSLAYPKTGVMSICLPSTSRANGRYGFDKLIFEWSIILEYLNI